MEELPEETPKKQNKGISPNVPGRGKGVPHKMRPRKKFLSYKCAKGPYATREDFFIQLHEFLKLEEEARAERWELTSWKYAAEYFGVSLEELNHTVTSKQFVKFVEARVKLSAKIATSALDEHVVAVMRRQARNGQDKEFMATYFKRQEMLGFDSVDIDDMEDVYDGEGAKLIEEFKQVWQDLNGGAEPNLYVLLPRILGTRTTRQSGGDGLDEGAQEQAGAPQAPLPDGPDPALDTVPKTDLVPQEPQEVHLHGGGQPSGQDGLVGG